MGRVQWKSLWNSPPGSSRFDRSPIRDRLPRGPLDQKALSRLLGGVVAFALRGLSEGKDAPKR